MNNTKNVTRDYGQNWEERYKKACEQIKASPQLSSKQINDLQSKVLTLDVSSPANKALLWSGRDIPTGIPVEEDNPDGPKWSDKLSYQEADFFRKLGIAFSLEDTIGGEFLINSQLIYKEHDPLFKIVRNLWDVLSSRFVRAATGQIEIISEGTFDDSVFMRVELEDILLNKKITAINGLDRKYFPSNADDAFTLLRRWDVERNWRYAEYIASTNDHTPYELATAIDDYREIQLWYEQDFFDNLGLNRQFPALPKDVIAAEDKSKITCSWKYSHKWRDHIRKSEISNNSDS